MYRDAGYQGIVFTDHFHEEYFSSLGDMKWEDKIDRYLEGYREALDEGQKLGMDIFRGIELRFTDHQNDFLVYGLDDRFLKEQKDLHKSCLRDFHELIKDNHQILVFQAHPFRPGCRIVDPALLDGVEIFNGNPRHDSRNHMAAEVAMKHGLHILSGSDFHRTGDLASGGILTDKRIGTQDDLIRTLKSLVCESLIMKERICV